ncbi:MAG: Spy/CpxP family protein refolding chaperone [Syntrophorhabdaceae bacterium]|nr:Spy/CpxP family protein refolding chaperone [Syntrophorhabdaceae bacterium]MDD5242589.1 Spy/CpxP family protein refolding chaperone [Syntrophorhabdaceae bacterium]
METKNTDIREGFATTLCCILSTPVKRRLYVTALVLFFMALCVAVFAGEPGQLPDLCDLQGGLAGTLNLSHEQCKKIQELADRFRNDSVAIRGRIMEKRFEHMKVSEDPQTDQHTINKLERELNDLEREFARMAQRAESEQRRVLNTEQIKKMSDSPYDGYGTQGYDPPRYGRKRY